MQNLYPLFERNRILKKELMWSLRDYSFTHIQLEYQAYADGMIKGCDLEVRGNELVVGKGIVKYGGFIYLITEEMSIAYEPTERLEILKMKMETDKRSEDFIAYRVTLFLDEITDKKEDELEVCRFRLRRGSRLRNEYKDFEDMATGYDTVNRIEADWGGLHGKALSPSVTEYFSKLVLKENGSTQEDIQFAYLCLNQQEAVSPQVLKHYIGRRLEQCGQCVAEPEEAERNRDSLREGQPGNRELFDGMVQVMDEILENQQQKPGRLTKRAQIIVD